jgi:hypothetical protein
VSDRDLVGAYERLRRFIYLETLDADSANDMPKEAVVRYDRWHPALTAHFGSWQSRGPHASRALALDGQCGVEQKAGAVRLRDGTPSGPPAPPAT